jgi:Tol biopolymer transport system component/predicted Ser/Thr protein kinase
MTDYLTTLSTALAGRYHVERELGQGGMAVVYLARDVRHDRSVALKVLRPELAAVLGAERFLKEIKTTANLQHPHILPLHDSGEAAGLVYYVMPYVEGESLRDRLNREKQLSIDETVRVAKEVASALDYAHRHGVVHRDIKPENILLHDGRALVADFGIALAASRTDGATRLTETGLSLGTPAYMAPEQAMGERDLTAKADVYALGCVVYEMLVGQPPFTGPNAQAIIAAVLTDEPRGLMVQRRTVPAHVEAAVLKAIEKLPADRFASAQEFADALHDEGSAPARAARGEVRRTEKRGRRVGWRDAIRHPLTVACAALAVLGLGAAGAAWFTRGGAETNTPVRFELTFGPNDRWTNPFNGYSFALSPDGKVLVYSGRGEGGERQLFVRPMSDLSARPLPGTERAFEPFFSPDSRWIGYYNGSQLLKVPVDGGTPVLLAEVPQVVGASWAPNDRIVISTQGRIAVIPATGGEPRMLMQVDTVADELAQQWPLALPDGKTVLYQSWLSSGLPGARISVVDLDDGSNRRLELLGTQPLAVLDGRLVYASASGAIMAVAFDEGARRVTGTPTPVVDGVNVGPGGALVGGVSASGSLVYVARGGTQQPLVLGAPDGATQVLVADERVLGFPRFSPDGRHLAVTVTDSKSSDVWVFDLPSGPFRRLTAEGTVNDRPEWTPDSRDVLFRSNRRGSGRRGTYSLWIQPADGSRPAEEFFALDDAGVYEGVISSDGSYLLFQRDSTGTGGRTWFRGLRRDTSSRIVATAPRGQQTAARLSPDGRWVAYQSDELGSDQVYVKPFPGLDARYQVSLELGNEPVWAPDGKRLFYLNGQALMVASLSFSPRFHITARDTVFADEVDPGFPYHANYDVSPDGSRFVFVKAANAGAPVIVVHNWKAELDARTAPQSR